MRKLLADFDIADRYEDAASWYDGYLFGGETVYKPWSIVSYADGKSKNPVPFWIDTGL